MSGAARVRVYHDEERPHVSTSGNLDAIPEPWDYNPSGWGQRIPISARIMNICDQYDALRSPRPHKPALSHEAAVEILTEGDGRTLPSHFDPDIIAAFARCAERFREIFETIRDDAAVNTLWAPPASRRAA